MNLKHLAKGLAVAATALAAFGAVVVLRDTEALVTFIAPCVVALFAFGSD